MDALVNIFEEPEQSKQLKHTLCNELISVLLPYLPRPCALYPFGSSMNDCGLYDCDLDLYLDMGFPFKKIKTKVCFRSCISHSSRHFVVSSAI